jgi:predicted metal-binding membrane protein
MHSIKENNAITSWLGAALLFLVPELLLLKFFTFVAYLKQKASRSATALSGLTRIISGLFLWRYLEEAK